MTTENQTKEQNDDTSLGQPQEAQTEGNSVATTREEGSKFKDFYEKVTAPVKVNGHMMTFTDPDEIRILLSKGADYTQKTTELKRHKGLVALVLDNGINETELRSLIDVAKGSKEAIMHYAAKANIDLADVEALDDAASKTYEPKTKQVTPQEQAFNEALQAARQYPEINQFTSVLTDHDWQTLFTHPAIFGQLISLHATGDFQRIISEMLRLEAVNKLNASQGYLVAFNSVMQQLSQQGFLGQPSSQAPAQTPLTRPQPTDAQRKGVGVTRTSAPQKASPTRQRNSLDEINRLKGDEFAKAMAEYRENLKKSAR